MLAFAPIVMQVIMFSHFRKVNDISTETLHLDMWDEDEDSSFLDKENRLTKIKGVGGFGR